MTAMKGSIIGFALFLLVTSTWAGTFTDNFDDGNMDGWTIHRPLGQGGTWKIENGELVLQVIDGPIEFTIGEPTWKDYTVSVKVKMTAHQPHQRWVEAAGILTRWSSGLNSYVFLLGTGGLFGNFKGLGAHYVKNSDVPQHYESSPFDWKLNTWYELKVTAEGGQFKVYVDGKQVLSYVDATHPSGAIGIGAAYAGTTAHFDDFSVTGDDVPGTVAAVDPKAKLATTWAAVKGGK